METKTENPKPRFSDKYHLLIHWVHSCLIIRAKDLHVTEGTTVKNFEDNPGNKRYCKAIFDFALKEFNYELSYNQLANGIDLFLKHYRKH